MKRIFTKLIFFFILQTSTFHCFANPLLQARAGVQYPEFKSTLHINNNSNFPSPYDQDLYNTDKQAQAVIGISAGYQWKFGKQWFPNYSTGLSYYYFFSTNIGDTITQNSLSEFTNYTYDWNVTSNLILAFAKANIYRYGNVLPYFNIGIGAAFNRSNDYNEKPMAGVTPRESPDFSSKTTSNFAYSLGAGIDLECTKDFLVSIGYEYIDLGKVMLGSGTNGWSDQSLDLGSYRLNEIFLSVTYLY